jgi:hypothetical protein
MPVSASIISQSLRAEQLSHNPIAPRLWQAMRTQWQRRVERAIARSVFNLDHPGVAEDYRAASRFR